MNNLKQHKKIAISIIVIICLIFIGVAVVYFDKKNAEPQPQEITKNNSVPTNLPTNEVAIITPDAPRMETVAENLAVPWDLAFLPSNDLLITERAGKIKRLYLSSDQRVEDVFEITDVRQVGESGLHGVAVHPDFAQNNYIYLYYTFAESAGGTRNRVVRYKYTDDKLTERTVIIDNIPGAVFHDGGRIRFGPDSYLYVTTGDAQIPSLAQDKISLAGKILRVTDTGAPAPGNPFNSAIYSYGHRNPQGITWDDKGNLWETEHGPSGTGSDCCRDELNLIKPGQNYGWPDITGNQTKPGMISPILQSGESAVWALASIVYADGSLYFGGLRGQALYEAALNPDNSVKEIIPHMDKQLGRIRAVTKGPDGMIYISTSNRDGRGLPKTGDDKIIRINPTKL